jgi:hypothetical protein
MMRLLLFFLLVAQMQGAGVAHFFAQTSTSLSTKWTVQRGSFAVAIEAWYGTNASQSEAVHSGTTGLAADQFVKIRLNTIIGSNGCATTNRGVFGRYTGSGATASYYDLNICHDSTVRVRRNNAGTFTTLTPASGSFGGADAGDYYVMEISGTGATVTITVNAYTSVGALRSGSPVTYTDTSGSRLTAAGSAGVNALGFSSNFTLDDFYAGDLADGLPPVRVVTVAGGEYFISPTATVSGQGTLANPWRMQHVLYSGPLNRADIAAGSAFWARGGTYTWDAGDNSLDGIFTFSMNGTSNSLVRFKCYPGETCTLDPNAHCDSGTACHVAIVSGDYVELNGFVLTNSDASRKVITECGSNPNNAPVRAMKCVGTGCRIVNNTASNLGEGLTSQAGGDAGQWIGNIVYNNGWQAPDRSHGHGGYFQNTTTAVKRVEHGVFFRNMQFQFKAFSQSGGPVKYMSFSRNVAMGKGLGANGTGPGDGNRGVDVQGGDVDNHTWDRNYLLGAEFTFNADLTIADAAVITNNHFDGATKLQRLRGGTVNNNVFSNVFNDSVGTWDFVFDADASADTCPEAVTSLAGNKWYAINTLDNMFRPAPNTSWAAFQAACTTMSGGTYDSTTYPARGTSPSGAATNYTYAYRNSEDASKGVVVIYNWQNLSSVNVDVSPILTAGDPYEIVDLQNLAGGSVASGTYAGGNLAFDMTLTAIEAPSGSWGADPGLECTTGSEPGTFPLLDVSQISVASGQATATLSSTSTLLAGERIFFYGNTTDTDLNGMFTIGSKTSTTITYPVTNVPDGLYTDVGVTAREGGVPHDLPNWKHTEQYFGVFLVRRKQTYRTATISWRGTASDAISYGVVAADDKTISWDFGPRPAVSCASGLCSASLPTLIGKTYARINGGIPQLISAVQ